MEIIGIIIINYLFGFIGAFLRFIFINFWNLITSKKLVRFKYIWSEKKAINGKYDNFLLNVVLGAVVFFIFTTLVIKFNLWNMERLTIGLFSQALRSLQLRSNSICLKIPNLPIISDDYPVCSLKEKQYLYGQHLLYVIKNNRKIWTFFRV